MEHNETQKKSKRDFLLPASILIAALLISGAVFYNAGKSNSANKNNGGNEVVEQESGSAKDVQPISRKDHKLGSDDAPIKIIAFTDLECPFCKEYHLVLKQVMKEMPGKIQFVLRNFPLTSLHKQAKQEAVASECVADLGGEDAFWNFVDKIFDSTKSNDGLDLTLLPTFATQVGVDKADFEKCLTSGKFDDLIASNIEDGNKSGLRGTPYSVVIAPNGQYIPLSGYMPADQFKQALENILTQK